MIIVELMFPVNLNMPADFMMLGAFVPLSVILYPSGTVGTAENCRAKTPVTAKIATAKIMVMNKASPKVFFMKLVPLIV
jgi:hypothetical protein